MTSFSDLATTAPSSAAAVSAVAALQLDYPADTLLVLAGPPGSGKSTLISRLLADRTLMDLSTLARDAANSQGALPSGFTNGLLSTACRGLNSGPVVVELSTVDGALRRTLAEGVREQGHAAHLVILDVPQSVCRAALDMSDRQYSGMDLYTEFAAWENLLREYSMLQEESWTSVSILDRPCADSLTEIRFGARR